MGRFEDMRLYFYLFCKQMYSTALQFKIMVEATDLDEALETPVNVTKNIQVPLRVYVARQAARVEQAEEKQQ